LRNERHGDAIQAICSDNGSEFRNSHFETFCHDLGLEHQFLIPYTPPQNGVVERRNRTLCEMAWTTLDEHRTPRRFWAEAEHEHGDDEDGGVVPVAEHVHTTSTIVIEGSIRRPERGGSEWEPIKILPPRENSAYTLNSQPRIPARVCQGHVVITDLLTLGTNSK
jgi:hypothetical protein